MIEKRTWMPYYQLMLDEEKNCEVRIADFPIKEGEEILFREWDQKKGRYTGRSMRRRVKRVFHARFTDFNSIAEILQYGHYIMELESGVMLVDGKECSPP